MDINSGPPDNVIAAPAGNPSAGTPAGYIAAADVGPFAGHFRAWPNWRKANTLGSLQASGNLWRWLRYPRSLTAALTAACPGRFSVRLLSQGSGRPGVDESAALRLERHSAPIVRQVQLCCDEHPWVFARTIIPRATMKGEGGRLSRLGNRPLGALLFADPGVRRGPLQVARLVPGQALFVGALGAIGSDMAPSAGVLWARRCVHYLESGPLLVTEVFLHSITDGGWRPPTVYGNR